MKQIIVLIFWVVVAIIGIFLEEGTEKRISNKKIIKIVSAIIVIASGLFQFGTIVIQPPEIKFDDSSMIVRFVDVPLANTIYSIKHDFNADSKWENYSEKAVIHIEQVPTYLEYKSRLWFNESASDFRYFRKDEDGNYHMYSEIDHIIGSGVEEIVWEPETSFGWGPDRPSYTMDVPPAKVVFNSISDNNKEIGNEFYFVSASEYTGDAKKNYWSDYTYVKEGHEYVIRIYVHNNASSNLDLTAHDVRAFITLPNEYARKISVGCLISCPDAEPERIWDGTNFYSDDEREFALEYVDDSLRYYNNAGTFRLQDETQGDYSAFTNKGVLLGFDEMDGAIPGCIRYSGYITFHVKPIFQN